MSEELCLWRSEPTHFSPYARHWVQPYDAASQLLYKPLVVLLGESWSHSLCGVNVSALLRSHHRRPRCRATGASLAGGAALFHKGAAGGWQTFRTGPQLAAAAPSEATSSTPSGHCGIFTPSDSENINRAAASGLPVSCLGLFYAAACNVPHLVQIPVRAAPVLVKANVLCLFIAHRRHQVHCGVLALPDGHDGPDFARHRENVMLLVATWSTWSVPVCIQWDDDKEQDKKTESPATATITTTGVCYSEFNLFFIFG